MILISYKKPLWQHISAIYPDLIMSYFDIYGNMCNNYKKKTKSKWWIFI